MKSGLGDSRKRILVSLGDSYSSGEGIPPYYDQGKKKKDNYDWLAHRSENSWPGRLELPDIGKMADHKDDQWFFAAVSGAMTQHFKDSQEKWFHLYEDGGAVRTEIPPQLQVLEDLKKQGKKVDYVTLTIGGNDAGFADIMKNAVYNTILTPFVLQFAINEVWKVFFKKVGGTAYKIYKAYKDVAQAVGEDTRILVVGYPKIFSPEGCPFLYSGEEVELINNSITNINRLLKAIVSTCQEEGMKIRFVSVEKAFEGHGAFSKDPFIHGIKLGSDEGALMMVSELVSSSSLHPNEKGAQAYAACVQRSIDEWELQKKGLSLLERSSGEDLSVNAIMVMEEVD